MSNPILINQGTQSGVAVDTVGTVNYQIVKLDTGASGVSVPFTLPHNIFTFGTTFGGTAAMYGTLVGSASVGVGTSTWINDLSIINSKVGTANGTVTCMVGFGTALNGSSVLAKGDFGPQGGIQKSYPLAVNAGMTNQDLVCYIGAGGTVDFNVSYFIST